jgi:amidohydrolase
MSCHSADGYPATVNAYPDAVKLVRSCATAIVGEHRSCGVQKTMGAEDFSYFLEARPGAFIFVGAALPGDPRPHHKSVFDIDENSILISASVLISIVREKLFK